LATLLDPDRYRDNGGGDLGPANQSPADDAMKSKRKKRFEVVMCEQKVGTLARIVIRFFEYD
jgi:hypothetical protein